MKTAAIYTLGCKVNQYEADAIGELFTQEGYRLVSFSESADVYVIHSCAVTAAAERKSRQMIRRARRQNSNARIVVSGCYAQVGAEALKGMMEVDLLIGTDGRAQIVQRVEDLQDGAPVCAVGDIMQVQYFEELTIRKGSDRTRAFLKIQEGCNQYCSYCIVPFARGPLRSRELSKIIEEAQRLSARGFAEIVLTGVNLGLYGLDRTDGKGLAQVLQQLNPLAGVKRIRISSLEPTEVTEELLDTIENLEKVCRHFHIPLQSGADRILEKMNRRYRGEDFMKVVASIRRRFPRAGLTTDVIVGFPGEEECHFEETARIMAEAAFSRTHIFSYSPRPGTPAATMPKQVPGPEKERRSQILHQQAACQSLAFHRGFLGQTVGVLAEKWDRENARQEGLTEEYIRVMFCLGGEDLTGRIVPVSLQEAGAEQMHGIRLETEDSWRTNDS